MLKEKIKPSLSKSEVTGQSILCHTPPVKLLRVADAVGTPYAMVVLEGVQSDVDLQNLESRIKEYLSEKVIALNFDFYPVLPHPEVEHTDLARDFQNIAAAKNFYNQLVASFSERALDISLVADNVSPARRFTKYSKYPLDKHAAHPLARPQFTVSRVTCVKLFDATQQQIETAGFTYSPNNIVKRKLNSRFVDAIKSIDPTSKPTPDTVVAFLQLKRVKRSAEEELAFQRKVVDDMDKVQGQKVQLKYALTLLTPLETD